MNQFTPGPWKLIGDVIEGGKTRLPIGGVITTQIAKVNLSADKGRANAALLLAAPELHKALTAVRTWLMTGPDTFFLTVDEIRSTVDAALALVSTERQATETR